MEYVLFINISENIFAVAFYVHADGIPAQRRSLAKGEAPEVEARPEWLGLLELRSIDRESVSRILKHVSLQALRAGESANSQNQEER